jgi:hypothetical protein
VHISETNNWHPKLYLTRLSRKSIIVAVLIEKHLLSMWLGNENIWDSMRARKYAGTCNCTFSMSGNCGSAGPYFRNQNPTLSVDVTNMCLSNCCPCRPQGFNPLVHSPLPMLLPPSPSNRPVEDFQIPLRLKRQSLAAIKCNIVWLLGALHTTVTSHYSQNMCIQFLKSLW